ncbi:myogenesis-regulating glycosidase isoform X2 [Leptidea sinapis]|uniref:myogenesis-regulating glycosidase isoform X2 n=1 Tax=Leptidea sinapis TaxID=189913 RepID=UPI0021444710|nr:myogenesis-regulating glycosidase isoform X2 [Leptidea sinapis]
MRVRKKPDLRLNIPSYPHDYVEMPPETKRLILEANASSNDIQYIDEDTPPQSVHFSVGSPALSENANDFRSTTPEVKILVTQEDGKVNSADDDDQSVKHSPVVYRNHLRRNSVSAPTQLKNYGAKETANENIPEHHQSAGSGFSDDNNTAEDTTALSDDDRAKSPLRSPRRKSRRYRSEFSMDEDYSPNNSVTSVNSLASLLKEKLQSIPQKIRKKPTDYKLRAFVLLMFLAVAFFIGFAYTLYHQKALTKAYFQSVQFNEPKRMIRIYNRDDVEILRAHLAVGLEGKKKAFPCLPEDRRSDGSECLEWLNNLRFYLKSLPHDPGVDNTTCYAIHWKALRSDVTPTDCFDWSETKTHWYGGGQSLNLTWPLDSGTLDFTPFITGDMQKQQLGNVLTRYLINSKGAAIIINDDTPLHISVNNGRRQICIKAEYDGFAFANKLTEFAEMKYNICTSVDMKSLHSSIHSHRRAPLWDGLKPADMLSLESLISEPVWQIAPRFKHELRAETISKYTEDVIDLGFLKLGHVLVNEFWQNEIGDLSIDMNRFLTLNSTVDKLHRRGFKVAFTLQPYISTESVNFAETVQKRLLITERNGDRRIPALTRFKSLDSAGVLDVTDPRAKAWILEKLQMVIDEHHIDAFYFDLGTAYDMPHYYRCEKRLINPDQYKTAFVKSFERTLNIIGVSSAISLPRPPIFVSLPPFESSWDALRTVIPTMLTYGVNGYPFIMPGAVGGDIYWPGSEQFLPSAKGSLDSNATNSTQENGIALPEKELYMRWLQMATFLPVMKFTHLPSKYNDERVLEMAKNLTLLRQKFVTPLLLKYKREALEEGLPLIRPLWLVADGDPTLLVKDEFAIGDEIVVAPVLHQGQTTREVYLPTGLWQDGIDGSLRKGNRWMHEYKVPTDRVAYFLRKPDDMRFR